jgi:hypothetical protein
VNDFVHRKSKSWHLILFFWNFMVMFL